MRINNKGFTLVELLAVIVILAIILAIAVPTISSLINSSSIKAYQSNEKMMVKAAKTYMSTNESLYPSNIGDTTEVTLNQLQVDNYISSITLSGSSCNGYVLITKVDTNNYSYKPNLNCSQNIATKAEDKLISYYSFDDFQEPTQNLINNNSFESGNITDWAIGNATSGSVSVDNTTSMFGSKSLKVTVSNGGDQHQHVTYDYRTSIAGRTFTVSAWIKTSGIVGEVKAAIYWKNSSGGWIWSNLVWSSGVAGTTNWTRVSATGVAPTDAYAVTILIAPSYPANGQGNYWIDGVQIEEKARSSEFATGIREGVMIKDYSGGGNSGGMLYSYYPKWIQSGHNTTGAYNFDGVDDYIEIPDSENLRMNNGGTISAWIYPRSMGEVGVARIVDKSTTTSATNGYIFYLGSNNTLRFKINDQYDIVSTSNVININAWNHVVVTLDVSGIKLYVNGIDVLPGVATQTMPPNVSGVVAIGNRASATDRTFDGYIDEVRFYNRVLTALEIKNNYDKEK